MTTLTLGHTYSWHESEAAPGAVEGWVVETP